MTLSRRTFLTAAASLPLASCAPRIEPRAGQMALVPINAEEAVAGASAMSRFLLYQRAMAAGWMTADEARACEGLPPLADHYLRSAGEAA